MQEVAFVLLHYNNIQITQEAIKYIMKLDQSKYVVHIVIVDNASPNGTGKKLIKMYELYNNIKVILNKQNLGFAKGNNVGYIWAKTNIRCNYIIVMNTDVFIKDVDFLNKLFSLHIQQEIIAPDIVGRNGVHQNPFRMQPITEMKLKQIYWYTVFVSNIYRFPIVNSVVAYYLDHRHKNYNLNKVNKRLKDITPHGSCIIYSEKWISNENVAFDPNTFMYMEEDILVEYVKEKKYHTIYCPELIVYHMEDASIDASLKQSVLKRRFIAQHMRNSVQYLKLLKKKHLN